MRVRELPGDDVEEVDRLRRAGFGVPPARPGRRGLLAEVGGRAAGVLTITDFHQFWGGSTVPMGGIGGPAVEPGVRGALLDAALRDLRERGQAVSALFPTAPAVHRSRGWAAGGVLEHLELPLDGLPAGDPIPSRPAEQGDLPALHACYADLASTVNGLIDRSAPAVDVADVLELDVVSVVPGHDGELRGYLTASRDPAGWRVFDLVGRDRATQLGLLRQLRDRAGGRARVRVTDPAVTGLLTDQAVEHTATTWLLRVVDLPAAVAARGWPAARWLKPAAVDLEVVDEHAPWHAGRQRLVVEDGEVRVEAGGSGEVRLHARALGPWFSGLHDTHALRRAGLLDGAGALLDRLVGAPGVPRLADCF
ncbi:GNAT family N-acetyltransferase [Saccharothrix sp. S26]|uniref:GNAT family N-acetyltransferase n=1 Tax=Saccharothrix sp. S26 TaxID=2907215 RepID=UPI001F43F1FC|nr:GNAT family N-acetyltransferase [Saccharothrix sp. S26]MCE6994334.1 GNAT family N-acetyltransferase [Saccharothrix sp. S26]